MAVKVEGLSQFISHIGAVQAEAKKLDLTVVTGIAVEAKAAILAAAAGDVHGRSLSRFNNGKGVTLNARFVVKPGPTPTAILFPTPPGPWYLLEHGGQAHQIGKRVARRGKRGLRGQSGFLGNPALGFAAMGPVQHPAFAAKHTWEKGAVVAVAAGSRTFGHVSRQAYLKMFAG